MGIRINGGFIPFKDGVLTSSRFDDVECKMSGDYKASFFKLLDEQSQKNKSELISKLGGIKAYNIIEIEQSFDLNNIMEEIQNLFAHMCDVDVSFKEFGYYGSFVTPYSYLKCVMMDMARLINPYIQGMSSKENTIETLKKIYIGCDYINKLRTLPKLSKLFANVYEELSTKLNCLDEKDKIIAKISDLVNIKSKKYILEVSCDARDIMTASVSDNFTSCFDIKRGACNCASVNYLAIDSATMVAKLYNFDDENVKNMNSGIMDYHRAISRFFISVDLNKNRIISGRRYPDDRYFALANNDIEQLVFTTLTNNTNKLSLAKVGTVRYGDNYSGYEDYNRSTRKLLKLEDDCFDGYQDVFMNVGDYGCVAFDGCDFSVEYDYKLKRSKLSRLAYDDEDCDDDDYEE